MKIKAWVRNSDHDTISAIRTSAGGRKRIRPIHKSRWLGENAIYVNHCEEHPPGSPVVRVELVTFHKGNFDGEFLSEALVCPLCWKVLKKVP